MKKLVMLLLAGVYCLSASDVECKKTEKSLTDKVDKKNKKTKETANEDKDNQDDQSDKKIKKSKKDKKRKKNKRIDREIDEAVMEDNQQLTSQSYVIEGLKQIQDNANENRDIANWIMNNNSQGFNAEENQTKKDKKKKKKKNRKKMAEQIQNKNDEFQSNAENQIKKDKKKKNKKNKVEQINMPQNINNAIQGSQPASQSDDWKNQIIASNDKTSMYRLSKENSKLFRKELEIYRKLFAKA